MQDGKPERAPAVPGRTPAATVQGIRCPPRPERLPPAALALAGSCLPLLAVYLLSGPRTLPEADAGEFAAIAVAGGIAHPPGYPLYTLMLRALAPLSPLLGPVRALSSLSMACNCAAAALLCHTLMRRNAPPFAAWLATAAVFLSCNLWRAGTSIEPFALNLLLAAALLACCNRMALASAENEKPRFSAALGIVFGFGFCNHHSLALLAPLPLAVLLARPRLLFRRLAAAAAGFALGLAPLAGFWFERDAGGWVWGKWAPFLPRLLEHVSRGEYGGLTLTPDAQGSWLFGPLRMLSTLPRVLSYGFFALAVAGLLIASGRLLRRPRAEAGDGFAIGTAASFLTAGLLFPALFRLQGTALDDMIADRFFALPALLLAFPMARALAAGRVSAGPLGRAAFSALLLFHLSYQWDSSERASHRFFEDHLRNLLDIVEPDAVIVTVGDDGFSGGLYARYVLGHERVEFVLASLQRDWYRHRLDRLLDIGPGSGNRARRPLYLLDLPETRSGRALRLAPTGPLLRVVLPGSDMPAAERSFAANRALFARLRLPRKGEIPRLDAWEADILRYYRRTWDIIGRRLSREGKNELASRAFAYRDALSGR